MILESSVNHFENTALITFDGALPSTEEIEKHLGRPIAFFYCSFNNLFQVDPQVLHVVL